MRLLPVPIVCLALLLGPLTLPGQQRMTPDEVVRKVQEPGYSEALIDELPFRDCPQLDPHGVSVFEAVSSAPLRPSRLVDLAFVWRQTYSRCDYLPLQAWYERSLDQLIAANDALAVRRFIESTPDLSHHMREALWGASIVLFEAGEPRDMIAIHAVRSSDPVERVVMTIGAFRDRPVSVDFVYTEVGLVLWESAELFLQHLADLASGISDDRLSIVLGAISGYVSNGGIPRDSPGLAALRASIRTRRGLSSGI